jgi:chromate transporter
VIVAGAAVIGFVGSKWSGQGATAASGLGSSRSTLKVAAALFVLWWVPVIVAGLWQGWDGVLAREGLFFSKAAMVTFGGAYAVLPYVGQEAVENYHWLTATQMLDGLGLAETTPGPLIMVVQFVGFLGGWNQPGTLSPLAMATLGAAMTTWATFVPCYLWIFLGAPYIERLRGNVKLSGALSAVTAAVVGVVLNLAVWFGLQVFFPEGVKDFVRLDWFAVAICAAAFVAMQRFKVGVVEVVAASGALGLMLHLMGMK